MPFFLPRALSEVEIDEINQLRPSTSIPYPCRGCGSTSLLYPFINIIHPDESDDIYAELNRAPTVSLDAQTQAKRRQSCPPELLLSAPLLKTDKKALRKHGLFRKKRKPAISARTKTIQDMRERLDEKKLQNERYARSLKLLP